MDNKAYLEKISAEARPLKAKKSFFGFSPKLVKILIGAVIATFAIIIIGSIVSNSSNSTADRDYLDQIYLRAGTLSSTITSYNKRIKSSNLRSAANSLNTILTEVRYQISTYMKQVLQLNAGQTENTTLTSDEKALASKLNQTLEDARLSGILDRTYAREFALQTALLISLEDAAIVRTTNSALKSDLETSRSSLDQLHTNFDNFSSDQ